MAFSEIIPNGFPTLYDDEWRLGLNQMASRLEAYVDTEIIQGDGKRYQRIADFEARDITTRFGDTNPDDLDLEYRWLYVNFKDLAHILDRRESIQLGSIGSPHHAVLRGHLASAGRDMDRVLVNGIIGQVQGGKTGGTPLPFPNTQKIGVQYVNSGAPVNSGLTFDKLLEIATRFGISQVTGQDVENQSQATVVITPRQVKDLLLEQKMTSSDYGLQRLMNGEVVSAFGLAIKSVAPAILPYSGTATDIRTCVAFARRSVVFGIAENPQSFVDVLPGKKHDVQIRSEWGWGATRIEDEGVITIECDESP